MISFDPDRLDLRDPDLIQRVLPSVERFNSSYLRLRRDGLENIPTGPAIYVSNHNGGITGPDLTCTLGTLIRVRGADAPLYVLAHDFVMRHVPRAGRVLQRFGALRACPSNALRALALGAQVLVYPGGDLEAYRHSRERDRIVLGERTGFVRVAREAGVPIVPVVVHGAHRSAYIFHDGRSIARRLQLERWGRLERFPLALALPWGIAVGPWAPYLPLPFPIRLRVLAPIGAASDDDPAAVREHVRERMQTALDALATGA